MAGAAAVVWTEVLSFADASGAADGAGTFLFREGRKRKSKMTSNAKGAIIQSQGERWVEPVRSCVCCDSMEIPISGLSGKDTVQGKFVYLEKLRVKV